MIDSEDKALLCQHYLEAVYRELPTAEVQPTGRITDTYGEIRYSGVAALLSAFPLTTQDVFVDLGSGMGKLALQVFLTSGVRKVTGIELMPALHARAVLARDNMLAELPEIVMPGRELQFLQGDFFNVPFSDATVVLLGSPCFSPAFMMAMGEIINRLPAVRCVFTLRPIPNLERLRFCQTLRVQCSWDVALCYVYRCRVD
jgi:SAM-dependent methyltransferase